MLTSEKEVQKLITWQVSHVVDYAALVPDEHEVYEN